MNVEKYRRGSVVQSDANMPWVLLWLVVWHIGRSHQGGNKRILTIGVIAAGNGTTRESRLAPGISLDIVLLWHLIDTTEVYRVYTTIQLLDASPDVDLIVVLDYSPELLTLPGVLNTGNTPVITWGDDTASLTSAPDPPAHDDPNSTWCGGEVAPPLVTDDPYCLREVNITNTSSRIVEEPLSQIAVKAAANLVQQQKWTSVFVFHENATAHDTNKLLSLLSDRRIPFIVFNVDEVTDLHYVIKQIYYVEIVHTTEMNFVVLCRFQCTRKLFRTVNMFDNVDKDRKTLLKQVSRWLTVLYGHTRDMSRVLKACAADLDNIALVAVPEFIKLGCQDLETLLLRALREDVADDKGYVLDVLKQKANSAGLCTGYMIETLWWTIPSGRGFSVVGHVNQYGDVIMTSDLFPNTNYGYNKRTFLVSTLPYDPFVIKRTVNGTVIYEGFCFDILDELSSTLNFTYTVTEPEDQQFGGYIDKDNLTFNGLIGQLQREECDIVVGPVTIQADREQVVDFAYPYYFEFMTVILRKPHPNARKWRTLIDPFKWEVLVSIILALAVVTLLAFLLEKNNPFYNHPEHAEERMRTGGLHHLHDAFWYLYGALLCQGGVHLPDSTSGRTLVSCWWLFCLVMVGTYCGNLIAFLTVTKEKPPFDSLVGMVDMKGQYKWGTLGGTHLENIFTTSNLPDFKKVGEGIREFNETDPSVLHRDPAFHIQRVKQGGYAWIGDKTYIQKAMATECDLMMIKEEFLPGFYGFAFPNHSPHTLQFSDQMMKIHESGLLRIWKRQWWPKENFCNRAKVGSKPISLVDVQSAFYVCGIGIVLGIIALAVEIVVFRFQKCKMHDTTACRVQSFNDLTEVQQGERSRHISTHSNNTVNNSYVIYM